jgi:predicted small lipoprotein YifL
MSVRQWLIVVVAITGIVGCGLKGPLYLPGQLKGSAWPAKPQTPAPTVPNPPDVPASTDTKK